MSDIDNNNKTLDFGPAEQETSIIKVIGVGGGGGNAVTHMYEQGIHDVSFVLANTDCQALNDSPVPVHVQLGSEGLGAGNKPEKAREAANESMDAIHAMLSDGTKMVFVTAGMGGGTGTGAGPVIASEARKMGILTVGIVTIPFQFEGNNKIDKALDGVEEMEKSVDALLVINNQRLLDIYSDLTLKNGFAKANDVLSVAAKSIAEIITVHGDVNLDFNDVKTVLKDGGVAIMSTGYGTGDNRMQDAIKDALNSPLLNGNDVFQAKKILLFITHAEDSEDQGLRIEEFNEVTEFMNKFSSDYEFKWGVANDPSLGEKVKVTILATGFGLSDVDNEFKKRQQKRSAADIAHDAQMEEKERQKQIRRGQYYGDDGSKELLKRRAKVYLFKACDLDNEDLILAVENTPTFSRTSKQLESYENLSYDRKAAAPETAVESADNEHGYGSDAHGSVISFG